MRPYLDDGLFQERAHIVTITGNLIFCILETLDDWAAEIAEITADWTTTTDLGLTDELRAVLVEMVAAAAERDAHSPFR